jgi:hypothetical protein
MAHCILREGIRTTELPGPRGATSTPAPRSRILRMSKHAALLNDLLAR